MTFTQTMKGIFTRSPKDAVDNSSKGKGKRFLSKISGAFMLPISVMAIAGLFLGIGAAIDSNAVSESGKQFGQFIKNMGDPVFGAMPALFMMAIVISFTDDIGTAVFAGLIGYLVFTALQIPFIDSKSNAEQVKDWGMKLASNGKDKITDTEFHTLVNGLSGGISSDVGHAKILFGMGNALEEKLFKVVTKTWGMTSMSTSVFGGIIVGAVTAWLYNRFHEVELPSVISFFGGKRFVPFAVIIAMIPTTFLFLLLWPWVAIGLAYFGEYSGKVAGLDSFIFGFTERALIPFGLHHVFYAPLWWTAAGGDASSAIANFKEHGAIVGENAEAIKTFSAVGDQAIWSAISGLSFNEVHFVDGISQDVFSKLTTAEASKYTVHSLPIFEFFQDKLDLRIGRFMQGKFSFMQFGLPAAGAAMIMAAPKENRKNAFAIIFPASLTSFVTGVTEPIEFTFVFLAPVLFWGFHALMAAFSFLFMNLLGAHMGMTFSGGFIDTIVYGMIPVQKGTHFWWMYVIGLGLAPIYYFVFYWWIKHFNLATPGRGNNTKLFTKADYKKSKAGGKSSKDEQSLAIIEAYGGKENIVKTANCATRLRFDVKDAKKVSEEKLKAAGAMGVMKVSETHVQAIFGPSAEVIHGKIKKCL